MSLQDTDRLVADVDGGFVVYINGMRLNKLRAIPQWLLAGRKLARMFDELEADPDSGFLGYQPAFMGPRTGAAIQYWRSLEDLKRFANDPDGRHVPAWKWYDETVNDDGGVGFWAELYVVEEGNYETFFRNVRPIGIGKYATLVPRARGQRDGVPFLAGAVPGSGSADGPVDEAGYGECPW
ncbi:DUF4188 domain-containing protein [Haloarchaeobius sp. TZWWS8]|uniref:DUF4188 domain-containing protein n=1 Tax=Haloarchaeobius sp. TZWWS8 TaxID=3446121 RepID=UPI003EB6ADB5